MEKKIQKGSIGVTTENIFPIIKKFLYSDHDIFLRELVSNAVDATQKLKTLSSVGEFSGELGDLSIRIKVDETAGTITISDRGIGMTAEEIDRYLNQIALSSANDFLEKYKDKTNIIGHFGLGFYSAFMVSKKVEVISKSYKEGSEAIKWSCDGNPEYELEPSDKSDRGTDIILYIDDENKEFLQKFRIEELLKKYCRFLPIPIVFGKKQEWKDDKYVETDEDNVINDTQPAWTRKPSELTDEDYIAFYKELYPYGEAPLFWIHLNVDYPFKLTGILYFPRIQSNLDVQKNKIQLYCNQVFVTDSVEGIVPEFLTLMHGVIDSPDIPLNVSRSYLQSDSNVKKISNHISKKVADRLEEIFKADRSKFEEKWDSLKLFIEYGMLSEDKFYDRASDFFLLKDIEGKYYSIEEYKQLITPLQTDKDGNLIVLYCTDREAQYSQIEDAVKNGYNVLEMNGQLDVHWTGKAEQKMEKVRFVRVDSDTVEHLIVKEEAKEVKISDELKEKSDLAFKDLLPKMENADFQIEYKALEKEGRPVQIVQNEFFRRMKEMAALQGQNVFGAGLPESYQLIVNVDSPIIDSFMKQLEEISKDDVQSTVKNESGIKQLIDLAFLSNGMLKGEALSEFIKRSEELLK